MKDAPDVVLLPSSQNGNGPMRRIHIPDGESADSICRYTGNYRRRALASIGKSHEWCQRCLAITEADDD